MLTEEDFLNKSQPEERYL